MNRNPGEPEAPYANYLSRLIRPLPNFDFFFIKPIRRKAVGLLQLGPGARVLDLGCGAGGSFPYLVEAVGANGSVTGVDIGAQSCINARRRIASNRWSNVAVVQAAAQEVALEGRYDGALMFAAPDVFASESAMNHVFPHLREGSRVVFFGAKISEERLAKPLNLLLRKLVAKLSPNTPLPDEEPWSLLSGRVSELRIEPYFLGTMFLASGLISSSK